MYIHTGVRVLQEHKNMKLEEEKKITQYSNLHLRKPYSDMNVLGILVRNSWLLLQKKYYWLSTNTDVVFLQESHAETCHEPFHFILISKRRDE